MQVLAILLGASSFPDFPALKTAPSFRRSYEAFLAYINNALVIPSDTIDLFDSALNAADQDLAIAEFLRHHNAATDAIFYYIGHGYFDGDHEYLLTLHKTNQLTKASSGLRVKNLAHTIREHFRHGRVVLILDCCFAGEAVDEFMSPGLQIAAQKIDEALLPAKGTSLLLASSRNDPAIAPASSEFTMFSGALLEVLTNGVDGGYERLSLSDVAVEVERKIRNSYKNAMVRPELHSPYQPQGDIALHKIFPNVATASGKNLLDHPRPRAKRLALLKATLNRFCWRQKYRWRKFGFAAVAIILVGFLLGGAAFRRRQSVYARIVSSGWPTSLCHAKVDGSAVQKFERGYMVATLDGPDVYVIKENQNENRTLSWHHTVTTNFVRDESCDILNQDPASSKLLTLGFRSVYCRDLMARDIGRPITLAKKAWIQFQSWSSGLLIFGVPHTEHGLNDNQAFAQLATFFLVGGNDSSNSDGTGKWTSWDGKTCGYRSAVWYPRPEYWESDPLAHVKPSAECPNIHSATEFLMPRLACSAYGE